MLGSSHLTLEHISQNVKTVSCKMTKLIKLTFLCAVFTPQTDTQGRSGCMSHDSGVNVGHSSSLSDGVLPVLSGSLCVISASAADYEPR